jgi:hypothetical protein
MNLPSTTLASNPVARSSIARTSTSFTPRCSMRNSAWPVNERSQFHHSGNVGIEPLGRPIVAPGHTSELPSEFVCHGRTSVVRPLLNQRFKGEHRGEHPSARGVPPGLACLEDSSSSTNATRGQRAQRATASRRIGYGPSSSGGALCRPPCGAAAGAVANNNPVA